MNLPQIGELNRRVKIFFTVHLPDDRLGFSKATAHEDEVWGKIEPVGSIIYWLLGREAGRFRRDTPHHGTSH